jgi:hypothetical protein
LLPQLVEKLLSFLLEPFPVVLQLVLKIPDGSPNHVELNILLTG